MNKQSVAWNRLDNAAKIFPSNAGKRDTKVFRFACELYEEVNPALLQQALDRTIAHFPLFRSVLKSGLFWNYFEQSSLKPIVTEEHRPVCSPLYDPDYRGLLFEVTYHHRRISFDVFHALTDGTGAMQFLKLLVSQYLQLCHPEEEFPLLDYDASVTQKGEDSFQKYYDPAQEQEENQKRPKAYQIKGARLPEGRLKVIEGVLPVKELLGVAHRYHTTLTVLIAAVLIRAIGRQMPLRERKKPVVLAVPVNLRNYFDSETARNFFGVIYVSYDFSKRSGELDDIISEVAASFQRELTKERLSRIINNYIKIEKNAIIRIVPLPLKNIVLKQAGRLNLQESTSSLSNIGRSNLPEAFKPYVRLFDVICSTDRMQICLCSCGELLTASFSSVFEATEVQKDFFRTFSELGIEVEIHSNDCEADEPEIAKVNPLASGKAAFYARPEELARWEKKEDKLRQKLEKRVKKAAKQAVKQEKKRAKQARKGADR